MGTGMKINDITGNTYYGDVLQNQRLLPSGSTLYRCGTEFENGIIGRNFNVYIKRFKNKNKYYIVFLKI